MKNKTHPAQRAYKSQRWPVPVHPRTPPTLRLCARTLARTHTYGLTAPHDPAATPAAHPINRQSVSQTRLGRRVQFKSNCAPASIDTKLEIRSAQTQCSEHAHAFQADSQHSSMCHTARGSTLGVRCPFAIRQASERHLRPLLRKDRSGLHLFACAHYSLVLRPQVAPSCLNRSPRLSKLLRGSLPEAPR